MLAGTTFAWYTDSVTSSGNKIIAGTLDIELWKYEPDTSVDGRDTDGYINISESGAPIFQSANLAQNSTATLWEPGKTQVAYLKIKNNGDLALKYSVAIDVRNIAKDLYKVMKYAIVPDATQAVGVSPWAGIPDTSVKSVVPGTNPTGFSDISMPKNAVHAFALVIHMDEEAGNEYMAGEVDFDLRVLATQEAYEADSFGTDYDANAEYPPAPLLINTTASGNHDSAALEAIVIEDVSAISTIPAATTVTTATITGGSASTGELSRTIETTPGDNSVTYDISYSYTTTTTSGTETTSTTEAVTAFSNIVVNNLNIGPNLANVTVTHSHTGSDPVPMTALASADTNAEGYYYDYVTGILTIKSMTYSDFIVSYTKKIDVSSVTISGDATVEAGSTLALAATVLPANASYKDVAWTSSDETVATVDANGVVTGVAVGSVTITATADGQSDTFNVTVAKGPTYVSNKTEFLAAVENQDERIVGINDCEVVVDSEIYIPGGTSVEYIRFIFPGANNHINSVAGIEPDSAVVFKNCTFQATDFAARIFIGCVAASDFFEDCVFYGPFNSANNDPLTYTSYTMQYDRCTFTVNSTCNYGFVACMGGVQTFNSCAFDYTGANTMGTLPYTPWKTITAYNDEYARAQVAGNWVCATTDVVLNQCTRTNTATKSGMANYVKVKSTLTINN